MTSNIVPTAHRDQIREAETLGLLQEQLEARRLRAS